MVSSYEILLQDELPSLPVYGFEPNLAGIISLAITILLPVLVGLLTRASAPSGLKAVMLLLLAAVKSVLEAWLVAVNSNETFDAAPVIYTVAVNFLIAVVFHYGLWRPTGVSGAAQRSLIKDPGQP